MLNNDSDSSASARAEHEQIDSARLAVKTELNSLISLNNDMSMWLQTRDEYWRKRRNQRQKRRKDNDKFKKLSLTKCAAAYQILSFDWKDQKNKRRSELSALQHRFWSDLSTMCILNCQSQSELSTSSFRKCLLHFYIRNFQDKNLLINEFIFLYSWWMIKSES